MGLPDPNNTKITGEILYNDLNLIELNETLYNKIRGNDIGMIFQDPLSALNPLMKIEDQIKRRFVLPYKNERRTKTSTCFRIIRTSWYP